RAVIALVDDHGYGSVVLGGGPDHGWSADVDVLDAVVKRSALRQRLLERIEIDDQEVDGFDAMRLCRRDMLLVAAHGEQAAVDRRVQRLHAAIEHLGKPGHIRYVPHDEAGAFER